MSAPAKPATEQPTQPLAARDAVRSPESGVWLVPATAVAGALTGLAIRGYLDSDGRFTLAVVLLVVLLVIAGGVLLFPRVLDR